MMVIWSWSFYGNFIIIYTSTRQQINVLVVRLKISNHRRAANDKLCVDNVRLSQLWFVVCVCVWQVGNLSGPWDLISYPNPTADQPLNISQHLHKSTPTDDHRTPRIITGHGRFGNYINVTSKPSQTMNSKQLYWLIKTTFEISQWFRWNYFVDWPAIWARSKPLALEVFPFKAWRWQW